MPAKKLYFCNTLVVDELLYSAGGVLYRDPGSSEESSDEEASSAPLRTCQSAVYRYTTKENQWQRLQDMKVPRCQFSFVNHNEYLYAIGGESNNDLIKDVERYSLVDKEWERLPPLPEVAYVGNSSAISFTGKIFVYGAESRTSTTHKLQVFDPNTRTWHVLLSDNHIQGSYPSSLLVHNDTCYRVIYGDCECRSEDFGCIMHHICVHELLLDDINGVTTARIGAVQDQSVIPKDQDVDAFCVKDTIFITVDGVVYNIGDENTGQRPVNLDKWRWSRTIGAENCVVRLTFDKTLLE